MEDPLKTLWQVDINTLLAHQEAYLARVLEAALRETEQTDVSTLMDRAAERRGPATEWL